MEAFALSRQLESILGLEESWVLLNNDKSFLLAWSARSTLNDSLVVFKLSSVALVGTE
jgi:hypothetical protein